MKPKEIKCPQCGRLTFYSLENPYRPFCSERCRLIDLGKWADGTYKVPTQEFAQVDVEEPDSHNSEDNQEDA